MELAHLAIALLLGIVAKRGGLPPLVGYLAAGFALQALGYANTPALQSLADLGVTILLFTIGLKLRASTLLAPAVWGGALLHMAVSMAVMGTALFALTAWDVPPLAGLDLPAVVLIAFALSFSSTVFAVKVLDERGESASRHGNVAIGILVMQDILAVVFIAAAAGRLPSPWALCLLALFPLRPLLRRLLDMAGHGELLILAGFVATLSAYTGFEALGVKGDAGVLLVGALLAGSPKADELAKALFGFKDLLLVGFFLTIGLGGLPDLGTLALAGGILIFVPFKSALFLLVLTRFRLRVRTALFASATLSNFSEFGLIVGAVGVSMGLLASEWLVVIAVALSATFVVGGPLRRVAAHLYSRRPVALMRLQSSRRLAGDEPVDAGDARVIVLGMGRIGTDLYDRAQELWGPCVIGVDADDDCVAEHVAVGRHVVHGDASDFDFWDHSIGRGDLRLVLMTMPSHAAMLRTAAVMRRLAEQVPDTAPRFVVAGIGHHADEMAALRAEGVELVHDVLSEAGYGLIEHVRRELTELGHDWAGPNGPQREDV